MQHCHIAMAIHMPNFHSFTTETVKTRSTMVSPDTQNWFWFRQVDHARRKGIETNELSCRSLSAGARRDAERCTQPTHRWNHHLPIHHDDRGRWTGLQSCWHTAPAARQRTTTAKHNSNNTPVDITATPWCVSLRAYTPRRLRLTNRSSVMSTHSTSSTSKNNDSWAQQQQRASRYQCYLLVGQSEGLYTTTTAVNELVLSCRHTAPAACQRTTTADSINNKIIKWCQVLSTLTVGWRVAWHAVCHDDESVSQPTVLTEFDAVSPRTTTVNLQISWLNYLGLVRWVASVGIGVRISKVCRLWL